MTVESTLAELGVLGREASPVVYLTLVEDLLAACFQQAAARVGLPRRAGEWAWILRMEGRSAVVRASLLRAAGEDAVVRAWLVRSAGEDRVACTTVVPDLRRKSPEARRAFAAAVMASLVAILEPQEDVALALPRAA